MDFKKLWPSLIAAIPTILAPFYDTIIQWVASHPEMTLVLSTISTIIANLTRAPKQS